MIEYIIPENTYHFFIEGNIGAGKTTLFNELKDNLFNIDKIQYFFINEPIEIWTEQFVNNEGYKVNYFEEHYKNPKKHFQGFQTRVLLSYYKQFKDLYDNLNKLDENIIKVIVSDRSPFTMKYVFYDGLKELYELQPYEIDTYNWLYDIFFGKFVKEYYIININTPLNECYNNINKRQREGEETISLNFLGLLEGYTAKYINNCLNDKIDIIHYSYYNNNKIVEITDFINRKIIIENSIELLTRSYFMDRNI